MSEPARTLRMLADPISEVMPDHLRLNAFVHAGVEAAAHIEALEKALREVSDIARTSVGPGYDAISRAARAALGGKDGD